MQEKDDQHEQTYQHERGDNLLQVRLASELCLADLAVLWHSSDGHLWFLGRLLV